MSTSFDRYCESLLSYMKYMNSKGLYQLEEGLDYIRNEPSNAIYYLRVLSSLIHPKNLERTGLSASLGFATDMNCYINYRREGVTSIYIRKVFSNNNIQEFFSSVNYLEYFLSFDEERLKDLLIDTYHPIFVAFKEEFEKSFDKQSQQLFGSLFGNNRCFVDDHHNISVQYFFEDWLGKRNIRHAILIFHIIFWATISIKPQDITEELQIECRKFIERVIQYY